jgi:thiamine-phosphate pyrophosphorylase
MQIVVISNPKSLANEALLINQLFDEGLTVLHLRKPDYSVMECAQLLDAIDNQHYPKIALHQHHELAKDYGIKRIHYPEKLRPELLNQESDMTFSTSMHQLSAIKKVASVKDFDYCFFGPVFNSLSKPGYQGVLAKDFKLNKDNVDTKVYAIGGITIENIPLVKQMGFDGIALLGCLWNEPTKAIEIFKNIKSLRQ